VNLEKELSKHFGFSAFLLGQRPVLELLFSGQCYFQNDINIEHPRRASNLTWDRSGNSERPPSGIEVQTPSHPLG